MREPVWERFLSERDKEVMRAAGYTDRVGFGIRPALLVIDVAYAFCGDQPEPILQSIKRWRRSCGAESWAAIASIKKMLENARAAGIPVIYTTNRFRPDSWDMGSWRWKNSRSKIEGHVRLDDIDENEIVREIAPGAQDIVIYKQKPSAFFGTGLLSYLNLLNCDTLVLTGTSTSGCVRATAVDAFSYNYRVSLVEDCCFDRSEASHAITLFDLNAKYADVVNSSEVQSYFSSIPAGRFELPSGEGGKPVRMNEALAAGE